MSVNSQPRRFLAVWLVRLSTDRIERALSPRPRDPRVATAEVRSALRLTAMNAAAAALGLKPGMPLADARAMYPALLVDRADPGEDRRLAEAVCDWLSRYTPLAGLGGPDGIMLDVTGCTHLFGGEQAMRLDVLRRLEAQGFSVRAALAGTQGAAWALSRFSDMNVLEPGASCAEALASLPLAALRLDPATTDALARVGLKKVGDLEDRPRAPLAARFGAILLRRLDQALGSADEPLSPRLPVPPFLAERAFAEPVASEDFVLEVVERLAAELAQRMETRGEGARAMQLTLYRADGAVRRLSVATGRPLRDPAALCRLFRERFAVLSSELDPGFGFDLVRLSVTAADKAPPAQACALSPTGSGEDAAHLIDRLGVRFGGARVRRFAFAESHVPEFAVRETPAAAPPAPTPAFSVTDILAQDALGPVRPLRLFAVPEEIEAVAEIPDGPPARFRWRRVLHEVACAEGPERIAMEWWRDAAGSPLTRDYFRVEDSRGRRFWLFREGLYGRETASPKWYVHGLFA